MLQLLIGRSGSGKTYAVYEELKTHATDTAALFLLVPEQASYDSERRLLEELGPVLSQRVQVLSFTRMADTVFREIGGTAGRRMDTTLSLLLMSEALHSVADSLTLYRRHVDDPDYLRSVLGMLSECKQCAISPLLLEETAATLPNGLLKNKLTDLSLIFGAYEALVAQASLLDPQDDLTLLAQRLPESRLFDDALIYVDSFKGFTQQEFRILEQLMTRARTLTVTLCTEGVTDRDEQVTDRFATAARTARQLRDAARDRHVPVAAVRHLTENRRTDDPALLALERGCFAAGGEPYPDPTDAVCVTPCADRAEECRYAARLIRRLLRENGGYSRDFTVVARDISAYTDLLDSALRREGLPCCRDYREPILTQPLIVLIESALAAVNNGWENDDVLRIVKSGLAGFSTVSASKLENYVFVWNIRGRMWLSPFTLHPDGLTAKTDDTAARGIAYLDLLRRRLIRPLERLQQRLQGVISGREFAEAVFAYLQEMRVPRTIRLQTARLDAANEHALADHQERLWEYVTALLDKFALALSGTRLSAKRFADLFHLAAACDDLGSIPQGLDGVVIGAADRIRYVHPRTVIVLGANEGVFPAYPSGNGLLTDRERKQLVDCGLPMADDADWETAAERFYAYAAIAAPSERLIITYVRHRDGEAVLPSVLVEAVRQLVPQHKQDTPTHPHTADCESEADAFAAMASCFHENTPLAASYRAVFDALPDYAGRVDAMRRIREGFVFRDPAAARNLFGEHFYLSPTKVDTFHKCRFSYFCKYGLRARTRKPAEMDPAESGTLVHYVMQELLPRYCDGDLSNVTRDRVAADTRDTVRAYVESFVGGTEQQDAHFAALIERLILLCEHLLWRVIRELQDSRFRPVDFELPIGRPDEDGVPSWVITTPEGASIRVCGTIDRVDAYREGDTTYLRVLDYKTGKKEFELADVLEGLNLQMMIYLFSLAENGQSRYGHIVPAGVLYQPAKIPVIQADRDLSADELERRRLGDMKTSGLLLNDEALLRAMEPKLEGLFIPAALDKNGNLKKSASVASLAQFGRIKRRIQDLLTAMVRQLHQGDIAAIPKVKHHSSPAQMLKDSPCRYCDFRDICGREDTDPLQEIAALSLAEALEELDKEVTDDE